MFDAREKTHKSPFGAVKTEENVTFTVAVLKSEAPCEVFFVCRKDGESNETRATMQYVKEDEAYLWYTVTRAFYEPALYFYRFEFSFSDGIRFIGNVDGSACVGDWLPEWQLTVYDKNFETPDWAKDAVMYQIFPDRFCRSKKYMPKNAKNERIIHKNWFDVPNFLYETPDYKGNDFFMGNLLGIKERIDYLKSLGVTVVYLNPVFESPENHRYSTADYKNIDPYLGTNEDFSALCEAFKRNGIRVILDGVFSHTGADSIYFNKFGHYDSVGAYEGAHSPYYNWYQFDDSPVGYASWWGFSNLPNVNETHPDYLEFITGEDGVLSFWQKMGASGWRLDVADELPDAFLDALRDRVKREDPDALIIGEVWEDATTKESYGARRRYLLGKELDSVMNYPWRTAVIEFVKHGDAKGFQDSVLSILENYPEPAVRCLMNSISTHDTRRAMNEFGLERTVEHRDAAQCVLSDEEYERGKAGLMAATFLLNALPGMLCIYYGDEAGLAGERDPYARMGFPYGKEDLELTAFFKKMGKIKRDYRRAFLAPYAVYAVGAHTIKLVRGDLIFFANMGSYEETVTMEKEFVTIYGENGVEVLGKTVKILPKSYAVFKEKK